MAGVAGLFEVDVNLELFEREGCNLGLDFDEWVEWRESARELQERTGFRPTRGFKGKSIERIRMFMRTHFGLQAEVSGKNSFCMAMQGHCRFVVCDTESCGKASAKAKGSKRRKTK
mmetsp:Transcript_15590/g.39201  ORF Transcript_15590/g.39201 Transcript_15590/m.39201 type:complete len:116 (-) Transcript_15590:5-352(-)